MTRCPTCNLLRFAPLADCPCLGGPWCIMLELTDQPRTRRLVSLETYTTPEGALRAAAKLWPIPSCHTLRIERVR
jgi:hypothetical protein